MEINDERELAFFDFDRTLICCNSARLWVRYELAHGHISMWQAVRAVGWLLSYHLGRSDLGHALRAGIATVKGLPEEELRERTRTFYETHVRHRVRPGARRVIAEHRARGTRLVMLTTASPYLAQPACRDLGLDDAICTRLQVDSSGMLTGDPVEPMCFGEGKLSLAEQYVKSFGTTLERCAFYTDSASDLPVMRAVGLPIAVHPDVRLKHHARRAGWQVVDWGCCES